MDFKTRFGHLDRGCVPLAVGHSLEIRLGTAWPSGLDKREQHIADQIFQANEANQKAKDLLAGYEKKLADSQDEVRAILEKGRRDAEQVGRTMIEKAKADAKAETERMLKQIDAATTGAIKELADRSACIGCRTGRQNRPCQTQPQGSRQAHRASRGWLRREQKRGESKLKRMRDEG